jgi:hypothetical protein
MNDDLADLMTGKVEAFRVRSTMSALWSST